MIDVKVEVRGIRELATAFRRVDAELPKQLKSAFLGVAQRVVRRAQAKMEFGAGKAASSVKARASARGASIAFGGQAAPYEPWLDFGGSVGRGHKPGVAWSGSVKRDWRGLPSGMGRYVYPAIKESREDIAAAVDAAVFLVARSAGFDVR